MSEETARYNLMLSRKCAACGGLIRRGSTPVYNEPLNAMVHNRPECKAETKRILQKQLESWGMYQQ